MTELRISSALKLPLDVVTEASAIVATRGAGKSSASAVIVEEAFDLGVQVVVFDRTGVYWGLRSNAKGDGPGLGVYVLGGPHGDVPLEENAGGLIADLVVDSGHSFVLDLSDFSKSAAVRFSGVFLERLYDRKARARATTLLVMDEAHFYAPQTPRGGFKGDSAKLMGAMEDVVGLGRSRGLGVVLTTQRTQALNKAILDLIETLLVMRMLSPRARNAVKEWIQEKHEEDEQGVIPTLDSLPTGTAWVWSPLRGLLQKVPIRRIRTFDSYATPKPGQTRVEPKARKELDLAALGEQMQATVERAKAEDPKELRKQIAELRRELAQRPTEKQIEIVTEQVEIPVLADGAADRLEQLVQTLSQTAKDLGEAGAAVRTELQRVRTPGPSRTSPAAPSPPVSRQPPAGRQTPRERPAVDGEASDVQLKAGARRMLTALASLYPTWLTRAQVGTLAKVKHTGGTFGDYLSALRTAGAVEESGSGRSSELRITDRGFELLGTEAPAPATPDELLTMWRDRLKKGAREMLDALVEAYPNYLSREELAQAPERPLEVTGGTFGDYLSMLRRTGLIEEDSAKNVKASDTLFLGQVAV